MTSFIVAAQRTPIGSWGGALATLRVDDMLAQLLKAWSEKSPFPLNEVDDVIIGCANQAGEDNRNLARMSVLLAGFPNTIPATTINRLCGSSLDAVLDAHGRIQAGLADCVIAGGAESMSRAPYVMSKAQSAFDRGQQMWDTALGWRFPNPKLAAMFPLLGMGETAEEVQKLTGISRVDQDAWALRSHERAIKAQSMGLFNDEIIPLTIEGKKESVTVTKDEAPRADTSLEKLAKLRPAFAKDGSVTAGNSSGLNDGAAMLVICSEAFLKRHNLKPLARITGGATAGRDPNTMGLGPVDAVQKLSKRFGQKPNSFDLVELNEAFAVQVLGSLRALEIDPDRVNRLGGSIALGHPLGCSGARILTTLLHQMKRDPQLKSGLASMCIGVGQGIAVSVENCS